MLNNKFLFEYTNYIYNFYNNEEILCSNLNCKNNLKLKYNLCIKKKNMKKIIKFLKTNLKLKLEFYLKKNNKEIFFLNKNNNNFELELISYYTFVINNKIENNLKNKNIVLNNKPLIVIKNEINLLKNLTYALESIKKINDYIKSIINIQKNYKFIVFLPNNLKTLNKHNNIYKSKNNVNKLMNNYKNYYKNVTISKKKNYFIKYYILNTEYSKKMDQKKTLLYYLQNND
jgi:hypothetical protein